MQAEKILALQTKLSKVDEDKKAHLLSYLPNKTREDLENSTMKGNTISISFTMQKLGRRVDVSHFKDYLDHLPEAEKEFYISAFPKYKQVQLTNSQKPLKEFITKRFSEHVLYLLFTKSLPQFPPPTLLPMHKLSELLSDTGISLSKLVYYLGFFDVVKEVKTIISKKTLKLLQESFDPEEIAFINKIGSEEKIMILSQMNLHVYKGDKKKLKELILERGLYRFTQGIKNIPFSYHFFFCYFLPKNLSDKLQILLKQKQSFGKTYTKWEDDILTTWRFLCTYSK